MPTGVYKRTNPGELKRRLAAIKRNQSVGTLSKISHARALIDDAAEKGRLVVMFSGGRDSCAVAWLAKKYRPTLLYCDTGLSAKSATDRVNSAAKWLGLPLAVVTPEQPAFEIWQSKGHYPIGPKRGHTYLKAATGIKASPVQCCYWLKERPAKNWLKLNSVGAILWGNRAEDSNRRKLGLADYGQSHPPTRWPCWSYEPVAYFTDADVSAVARQTGLKFESRAETGCQVCCTDLARKDAQLRRCYTSDRPAFNAAMRSGLGAQILKANGLSHSSVDVEDALAHRATVFLSIPQIGKPRT